MFRSSLADGAWALVFCFGLLGLSASAQAQNKLKLDTAPPAAAAAASAAATTPAAPAVGGIQGQNIFEVKPDADKDANYDKQTNAQRAAVQPGNNAPMWRDVGQGKAGYTSLPAREAPEAGVLIQPFTQYPGSRLTTAGEAWRQVRNNWIIPYGGALLCIVILAIGIFYFTRGTIATHNPESGRKIERFTPFERAAHWTNAITFCVLAVSGLVMAFGKFFLLPVIGSALFGWLSFALKNLHNFAGPLFAVSLVVVFGTFLRDNWPQRGDLAWILKGGGLLGGAGGSGHEPPSNRFNAGEKVVFWGGVFAMGLVVVGSGLVLDKLLPGLIYERSTMQVAHMVHAVAAVLMMCLFLGHIYLGTIGMQGAFSAMRTGYVDESWAKEHHAYWYEDVKSGKIPAQRSPPGAPIPRTAQA